jgi:hypothetical protein
VKRKQLHDGTHLTLEERKIVQARCFCQAKSVPSFLLCTPFNDFLQNSIIENLQLQEKAHSSLCQPLKFPYVYMHL